MWSFPFSVTLLPFFPPNFLWQIFVCFLMIGRLRVEMERYSFLADSAPCPLRGVERPIIVGVSLTVTEQSKSRLFTLY